MTPPVDFFERVATDTAGILAHFLDLFPPDPAAPPTPPERWAIDVTCAADLLLLRFSFINLIPVDDPEGPVLLRENENDDAFVVVRFPPQSLVEQVFDEHPAKLPKPPPPPLPPLPPGPPEPLVLPAQARLAQPSRLAFKVRRGVDRIPLTLESLLDWGSWAPHLAPRAGAGGRAAGRRAAAATTHRRARDGDRAALPAAALAGRLRDMAARSQACCPRRSSRTMAHAPAALRAGAGDRRRRLGPRRLVAGRGRQSEEPPGARPDLPALDADDRHGIVHQSANFALGSRPATDTAPILAEQLMLSATGGWLRAAGSWTGTSLISLSEWRHRATEGRDHYVKIVREGILFPFGHRAAVVKISERKVEGLHPDGSDPVAALRRRYYVIVRQLERAYATADYDAGGREFPFPVVRFVTDVTPNIDTPQYEPKTNGTFWVRSSGAFYPFALEGDDHDGRPVPFHAACLFVDLEDMPTPLPHVRARAGPAALHPVVIDPTPDQSLAAAIYADPRRANAREAAVEGRRVAFVPGSGAGAGTGTGGQGELATDVLVLSAQVGPVKRRPGGQTARRGWPGVVPALAQAKVRVPALSTLAGATATMVAYHDVYLDHAFDAGSNHLEVFVKTVGGQLPFGFPADRAAGLATPSIPVDGLSRLRGPLGSVDKLVGGTFDPKSFFGEAKLLGGVSLADLIDAVGTPDPAQMPRIVSERQGAAMATRIDWAPRVKSSGVITWLEAPAGQPSLELHAEMMAGADGATPSASVRATLRALVLGIPAGPEPWIAVTFDELRCGLLPGQKPEIAVSLGPPPLTFGGPLSFVGELQKYLPTDGLVPGRRSTSPRPAWTSATRRDPAAGGRGLQPAGPAARRVAAPAVHGRARAAASRSAPASTRASSPSRCSAAARSWRSAPGRTGSSSSRGRWSSAAASRSISWWPAAASRSWRASTSATRRPRA